MPTPPPAPSRATEGNRVYVAARGQVFAIDLQTGRIIWNTTTGSRMLANPVATIIVVGDRLLVGRSGHVSAVDKHTGRLLWTQSLPGTAWATPLLASDSSTTDQGAVAAERFAQQQRSS